MAEASDNLIEIHDLDYTRGHRQIFKGLNISIARGEVTAIMGPSGTGKTTLLRLITRQLLPDRGTILIDGIDIASLSLKDLYMGFWLDADFATASGRTLMAPTPVSAATVRAETVFFSIDNKIIIIIFAKIKTVSIIRNAITIFINRSNKEHFADKVGILFKLLLKVLVEFVNGTIIVVIDKKNWQR